jgi:hypothetical protein
MTSDEALKKCLTELPDKITNVKPEDIAKVDKRIECNGKATADEELECLGKSIKEYGKVKYLAKYYEKDLGGVGGEAALASK